MSESSDVRDVVVIGAGPSGSMAAAHLAAGGRDVLVLEEHSDIGQPVHCTGLVGPEVFAEFGVPAAITLGRTGVVRFWGARGQSVPVRSDRVPAAVIDRHALDVHLAARAAANGAEIRTRCRAQRVSVEADGVRVATDTGDVRARCAILACGASYRFHRALGLGLPQTFLQSAQVESPFVRLSEIEVRFGRAVAPGGFAWAVPIERQGMPFVRLGLMSADRSRERFAAFASAITARVGRLPAPLPPPRLKMLPLAPVAKTYAHRVLAVGDAAGLVKPTTGGGIYYGLISGRLAAGVIERGLATNRLDERSLSRYESQWRKRLGQEIRVGLAFRRVAMKLDDTSIDELVDLARVDGIVPLLQRTASFNWHRKAAVALLGHPAIRRIVLRSIVRTELR